MGFFERLIRKNEQLIQELEKTGKKNLISHIADGFGTHNELIDGLKNAKKILIATDVTQLLKKESIDLKDLLSNNLFLELIKPLDIIISEDGKKPEALQAILIIIKDDTIIAYFYWSDKEFSLIRSTLTGDFIFTSFCKHKHEYAKEDKTPDCGNQGFTEGNFCTYQEGYEKTCNMSKNYLKLKNLLFAVLDKICMSELKEVKIPKERNQRRARRGEPLLNDYLLLKD